MTSIIEIAKRVTSQNEELPFSVYSSLKEQKIANVPVVKPLLIFVLNGEKKLGDRGEDICPSGNFVFLSNQPNIDMRNIPKDEEYFAILIEFDYEDFSFLQEGELHPVKYLQGETNPIIEKALFQFIDIASIAPKDAFNLRKKELLQFIYLSGYTEVANLASPPSISHKVHDIISKDISKDWGGERIASHLYMSESTLRRKLKSEGQSLQEIKTRTKLGFGLHLIQTTMDSIGIIAEKCGYLSQSRFTEQFKNLFGMTPRELRKTRMTQ